MPEASSEEFATRLRSLISIWREKKVQPGRLPSSIEALGGVGAAKVLLSAETESKEFKRLVDIGWWNLTIEAFVLRPDFRHLFTETELATADARLEPCRTASAVK